MGNFELLESEGLVRSFQNGDRALAKAESLLADVGAEIAWRERAKRLISRLADVTELIHSQLLEVGAAREPADGSSPRN